MTLFLERRDLLARFRAGERRALEEAYRFYAPMLSQFLSRGFSFQSGGQMMRFSGYGEPFDLDNVLAETFVRAFRESARLGYDGIHPYKNYLFTIARNIVIDELRGREVAMSSLSAGGMPADDLERAIDGQDGAPGTPTAEESLLAKELEGLCAGFVANLGDRDRLFFRARFEDARTQVEAGAAAGLSHMQARTLEKRLRGRFLRFLQAKGYLDGHSGERWEDAR